METTHDKKGLRRRNTLHLSKQRFFPFLSNTASFLVALFAGIVLFQQSIIIGPISTIINLGVDEQRAQLIAALLMTAGAALIGAVVGRRKLRAMCGAGLVFCFAYLLGFIQHELQPTYDPLGNLEPLNSWALVHTAFVMIALALLCAFVGAAVGVAVGEVLLDPLCSLVRFIRQHYAGNIHDANTQILNNSTAQGKEERSVRDLLLGGLGGLALVVLIVFAGSAGDLLAYSPDVGLHMAPIIRTAIIRTVRVPMHGTIVHDQVVSSALGGQVKDFLVYLPPSYNTPQGQNKRYPTLYLLHGSPGRDSDMFTGGKADQAADTLIALGKIPELIMVLPDGNGRPGQTSEWGNSFDHRQNIETYVSTDLVRYVDAKYRTIANPAYRGIGGLSMGGFGAVNIAIHHPDIFGYVSSLGGYYRAEGSIWGNNAAYMQQNSPIEVLPTDRQAWHLQMFIGAATKDSPYYTDAKEFVQELGQLHIRYHFDVENGGHSWHVWQTQMYYTLLWIHWGS